MRWFKKEKPYKWLAFAIIPKKCGSCGVHLWLEKYYVYEEWYANPGKYILNFYCPECGIKIYGEC